MKIECLGVTRWNKDTVEPVVLDAAFNLADYGYFQRSRCARLTAWQRRAGSGGGPVTACSGSPAPVCRVRRLARVPNSRTSRQAAHLLVPHCWQCMHRCSVKEFLTFALRTLAKRLPPGVHGIDYEGGCARPGAAAGGCTRRRHANHSAGGRSCVSLWGAGKLCYCFMLESGLGGIAICDKEYPSRVAVTLLREIVNEVKTGEHS